MHVVTIIIAKKYYTIFSELLLLSLSLIFNEINGLLYVGNVHNTN
jgi:hypothetical protein